MRAWLRGDTQVRCRTLVDEIQAMYEECEDMGQEITSLRAAAVKMEAWSDHGQKDVSLLIGGSAAEDRPDWEEREESEEDSQKRKAGVRFCRPVLFSSISVKWSLRNARTPFRVWIGWR